MRKKSKILTLGTYLTVAILALALISECFGESTPTDDNSSDPNASGSGYVIVDTGQAICYDNNMEYDVLPCAKTGLCADCKNDLRFCCYTVIIEAAAITEHGRINVVLIGEELGY